MSLMLVEVAPKRPVLHLAASLYLALVEHARGILKPAALNVALMPRGLIPIVFVLLFMAVVPQPCQAQSPEPALAPPAKLSELLRLMDDPEQFRRMLLAAGADVDARLENGATALMLASQIGHVGVAPALIAGKADINAKAGNGATALMLASKYRHQNLVQLLKAAGAK